MNWMPALPTSETTVPIYANGVEVVFSQWDFTFNLSHLFGTGTEEGKPAVGKQSVARVVMSPQHTKAFLSVLRQNVGAYEERFGPIPDFIGKPATSETEERP
jgi:hypothetical protein